ncbi:xanthine dehydrogenase family protein molybdopterin-binding subunit [Actinoplanes sp. NPDC051475]|uniref:xanthine dehydrogenase family protein molybdopterin-binding subunit n=1 Tax=Actinoplanes sp. NPDC051475 TaxID=3157225 RepID=UPI00344C6450
MNVPDARNRADGVAKVTGAARFAADVPVDGLRHAVLVTATVPAGRVARLETAAAEGAPGVVAVLTAANAPRLALAGDGYAGRLPLQDDRVCYEGEPIAVVVADRLERARAAARLVRAEYVVEPAATDLDAVLDAAYAPTPTPRWGPADTSVGDVDAGLDRAAVVVRRRYTTEARHHCAIEPSATLAEWRDGRLTLHDATQGVFNVRTVIAAALGLAPDRVRVRCEYTGGAFGGKGYVWPHQLIAAMTATTLGGAVRLVLTRAQTFTGNGYQPPTRQAVTLGADADGRLLAVRHESVSATATYGEYPEMAANCSRVVYASPAIETRNRVAPVATILPTPMRAPHEGAGMFALESAMDELAYELGLDPLELRLRNHAETDPTTGQPFSSKELLACYAEGARRFGWSGRPMPVRSLRAGDELVGWGVASAIGSTFRFPAGARVRVGVDGGVVVEAGCQEIGAGTYTVLPQLAAEALGCPPEQVTLRLGDTALPETGVTAGSSTTMSVGSAVRSAALELAAKLAAMVDGRADPATLRLAGAELTVKNGPPTTVRLADLLASHGVDGVAAEARWAPGPQRHSIHAFGAVFADVAVDELLGSVRVRRLVGVYSAGRIVNPLTARAQLTGGLIWGLGQTLMERSVHDARLGRYVSKNLSGYLLPVSADVPELNVGFVEEHDPHASAIGARGIGVLGAVGVGAAIANAVHHATGVRLRDLPITAEALCCGES